LVFADPSLEPSEIIPEDFPYWENVTQRRYEAPSAIYLGAGWVLTARHVGRGEIFLLGEIFPPLRRAGHSLLNQDGSRADAMIFELDPKLTMPDLPILPIANRPPEIGEEVLMIGFGRTSVKTIEWGPETKDEQRIAFVWSKRGEKRWGTNRVDATQEWMRHEQYLTRSMALSFSPADDEKATEHEAAATLGDSGGAIFVHRVDEGGWQLAGLITSISGPADRPPSSSSIGDVTYAADLSAYREELLRWTRPECFNELDDDGDGEVDYPRDLDCESRVDTDERTRQGGARRRSWTGWGAAAAIVVALLIIRSRRSLSAE